MIRLRNLCFFLILCLLNPALVQGAKSKDSCPNRLSLSRRQVLIGGTSSALAIAGGLGYYLYSGNSPEVHLIGERHGDAASIARKTELRKLAKDKKIILGEENLFVEDFSLLEKRMPVFAEDIQDMRQLKQEGVEPLEYSSPHSIFVYDFFKKSLYRYISLSLEKNLPEKRKLTTFYKCLTSFIDLLREEFSLKTLLEFLENKDVFLGTKISNAVTATELYLTFKELFSLVSSNSVLEKVLGSNRAAFSDGADLQEMVNEFKKLPKELINIFSSNRGIATLIALDEILNRRVVEFLKENKFNDELQISDEIIDYFRNFPSLTDPAQWNRFDQEPYRDSMNKMIGLDWRNRVMLRRIDFLIEKAKKQGKPLYLIVGNKHVPGIEKGILEKWSSSKLTLEKSFK